jgi:hypothetical protein
MSTRHLLVAETVIDHFSRAFMQKDCIFTDLAITRLSKSAAFSRPPNTPGKKLDDEQITAPATEPKTTKRR